MQAARHALRLVSQVRPAVSLTATRGVAMEGMKGFADAEKGSEDLFFTQVFRETNHD